MRKCGSGGDGQIKVVVLRARARPLKREAEAGALSQFGNCWVVGGGAAK